MDFVCDISSCIGNMLSFLANGKWWKDYGIPILEAVAMPLLIWYLTRYYGADKAEERKEIRQLRDNLNLLLSVSLDSILRLIVLRKTWLKLNESEKKYEANLWNFNISDMSKDDWNVFAQTYTIPLGLDIINVANYSSCIAVSENYVLQLMKLISAYKLLVFKLETRNSDLRRIGECNDLQLKHFLIKERISIDILEFNDFMRDLGVNILCLRDFICETKELENKYKDLILDNIKYSEEELAVFTELEKTLTKAKE